MNGFAGGATYQIYGGDGANNQKWPDEIDAMNGASVIMKFEEGARDLANDSGDRAIARSIIDLAGNLGMETVAEGAETDEQSFILSDIGCGCLQGFLYARPMPADQIPAAVKEIRVMIRKEPDGCEDVNFLEKK